MLRVSDSPISVLLDFSSPPGAGVAVFGAREDGNTTRGTRFWISRGGALFLIRETRSTSGMEF